MQTKGAFKIWNYGSQR